MPEIKKCIIDKEFLWQAYIYIQQRVKINSELGNRKRNDPNQNAKRKKSGRKQNRASKNYRTISNVPTCPELEFQDGVGNKATRIFKEVMAKNFPKLMKNNKTQTQEAQRTETD